MHDLRKGGLSLDELLEHVTNSEIYGGAKNSAAAKAVDEKPATSKTQDQTASENATVHEEIQYASTEDKEAVNLSKNEKITPTVPIKNLAKDCALPGKRFYFPALNGLRVVAYVLVILHHTIPEFNATFGPDCFYVLTGYLITFSLLSSFDKYGKIRLKNYFSRRLRNILPTLLILFFLVQVWIYYSNSEGQTVNFEHYGIFSLLQVSNWYQIGDQVGNYWEAMGNINPFGQFWSLSVTEQFFLTWPFLIFSFYKLSKFFATTAKSLYRLLAIFVGVAFTITAPIMAILSITGASNSRIYMGTDARYHEYVLGALAAVIFVYKSRYPGPIVQHFFNINDRLKRTLLACLTFASLCGWGFMIFISGGYDGGDWLYRGGFTLVAFILLLLVLSLSSSKNPLSSLFSHHFPVALGAYSYEIYALHLFVAMVIKAITPNIDPLAFFATTLVISSLFSAFIFHAITYRFRVRKFNSKRLLPSIVALTSLALVFSMWLPYLQDARVKAAHQSNTSNDSSDSTIASSKDNKTLSSEEITNNNMQLNGIVIGDSIANQYYLMFDSYKKDGNDKVNIKNGSDVGCGIMGSTQTRSTSGYVWSDLEKCSIWESRVKEAVKSSGLDFIFFSPEADVLDQHVDKTWMTACDDSYKMRYNQRLDLLDSIVASSASPNAKIFINSIRPTSATHSKPEASKCFNSIIEDYVSSHNDRWKLLDMEKYLCTSDQISQGGDCFPISEKDEEIIDKDKVHFSTEGVELVRNHVLNVVGKYLADPSYIESN